VQLVQVLDEFDPTANENLPDGHRVHAVTPEEELE
jgi:hypothetical protein